MLKEFERKIAKTKKHIDRLKKELSTIKQVKRNNSKTPQVEES
jgi:bacterioferritin (cytochrome b1)